MTKVAVLVAAPTDNTPRLEVHVVEYPHSETFHVYVCGGFCSTGVEEAVFSELKSALQFAAEEIRIALTQGA